MKKFYVWIFILCLIGIADAYAKGSSGGSRGGYSSSSFRSSSGSSYSSFRSSSRSKPNYQASRPAPVVASKPAPTPAPKVVVINRYTGNNYGNSSSRSNYSSVSERCSRGYEPVEWCVNRGYYHPRGKYYASNNGVSTSTAVAVGALAGVATGVVIAEENSNPSGTPPVVTIPSTPSVVPPVVSTVAATPVVTAPAVKSLRKVPILSCSDWNCDLQGS